jgi:hypothetical protein
MFVNAPRVRLMDYSVANRRASTQQRARVIMSLYADILLVFYAEICHRDQCFLMIGELEYDLRKIYYRVNLIKIQRCGLAA